MVSERARFRDCDGEAPPTRILYPPTSSNGAARRSIPCRDRAQLQRQRGYNFAPNGIEKALRKTESVSQFLSLCSVGKRDVEFLIKERL
jgi:hypothetical protein